MPEHILNLLAIAHAEPLGGGACQIHPIKVGFLVAVPPGSSEPAPPKKGFLASIGLGGESKYVDEED